MANGIHRKAAGGRASLLACTALAIMLGAGGYAIAQSVADGAIDTTRLPRVSSAKQVYASPATTIFTSPDSVQATGDTLDKSLAAAGWQKYAAPGSASSPDPNMRIMTFKKGGQALNVFITVAPAQNNATSVQYSQLMVKTDLPFPKDATGIEYSPDAPSLTLTTGEPIEKTLDFYRRELASAGWALWSEKTNARAPDGGLSGAITERGATAFYVNDKDPGAALALVLQKVDGDKTKLDIKRRPLAALEVARASYLNRDNAVALSDVSKAPRLPNASEPTVATAEKTTYSVPGNVRATTAALDATLSAEGWKRYVAPLDEQHTLSLAYVKGQQALSIFMTIAVGSTETTTDRTTINYSPARLQFALPIPDDASDVVFDTNRPYLNLNTSLPVERARALYDRKLQEADWQPLSAADATAKWPNARFADKPAGGDVAYYIRGQQRPIMLTLRPGANGKLNVEARLPPFAAPQIVEADTEIFGLPVPRPHRNSGGTGGQARREMHVDTTASSDAVTAFYKRELAGRGWKEQGQSGTSNGGETTINYTTSEGPAVLKIGRKYDLTTVSLALQVNKPPAATAAPRADSFDDMLKQAQQMARNAGVDLNARAPQAAPAPAGDTPALRALENSSAPIPVPETAEGVESDGGELKFTSASSVRAIADFYRMAMKQKGWRSEPSVINNANMVSLDFAKGGKGVSLTIMKMGPTTNVSATGSALEAGETTTAPARSAKAQRGAAQGQGEQAASSQPASADDLTPEDASGLPVPKRRTMSETSSTPFFKQLNASVPLDLAIVLDFYRRELGKLGWKEDASRAKVAAGAASLAFTTPTGPATLDLGRKNDETSVKLSTKNPEAARAAGILPKPGQAKVLFGNILPKEASLTFNNQPVKVAANAGTKAPDGPSLELTPGKYKYSIRLPGAPAQSDEVEIHADETWGLMIGPGGVLALQAY